MRDGATDARDITINAVAPGFIETDMTSELTPEIRAHFTNLAGLHRWGKAVEVANAIYFLASDEASFINGAVLPIDGGLVRLIP
jgi:3-oxoacyl-[acyl-carrier protein] reductase